VRVEVDVAPGLPGFTIGGLADAAPRESRERVRGAGLAPATVLAVLTRLEGDGLVVAGLRRYRAGGPLAATTPMHPAAGAGRAVRAASSPR